MSNPITVDIPHQIGKAAARARLEGGVGRLGEHIPGGAAVRHSWDGDTMRLEVQAMGQAIRSELVVLEDKVRATIDLPGLLGLMAAPLKAVIEKEGPKLLK